MPGILNFDPDWNRRGGMGPGMMLQRGLLDMQGNPTSPTGPVAPAAPAAPARPRTIVRDPWGGMVDAVTNQPVLRDALTAMDRVVDWGAEDQNISTPDGNVHVRRMPGVAGGGGDHADAGPTAADMGGLAGTGMPGGVGPDPGAVGGGYSGDGGAPSGGGMGADPDGSPDGYARGTASVQNLSGPNPKGPDDGYAALDRGEAVVVADVAQAIGAPFFNALNAGEIGRAHELLGAAMKKMPSPKSKAMPKPGSMMEIMSRPTMRRKM